MALVIFFLHVSAQDDFRMHNQPSSNKYYLAHKGLSHVSAILKKIEEPNVRYKGVQSALKTKTINGDVLMVLSNDRFSQVLMISLCPKDINGNAYILHQLQHDQHISLYPLQVPSYLKQTQDQFPDHAPPQKKK